MHRSCPENFIQAEKTPSGEATTSRWSQFVFDAQASFCFTFNRHLMRHLNMRNMNVQRCWLPIGQNTNGRVTELINGWLLSKNTN